MKLSIRTAAILLPTLSLSLALSACNGQTSAAAPARSAAANDATPPRNMALPKCPDCGTISAVEEVKTKGSGSGVGAVAGAVVGGVVGHQIGDGRGQDAATAAGAIGGGFAGNEIEKRAKATISYRVTVAMENGTARTVNVDSLNGLSTGSRVRVVEGNLRALGS